MLVLTRRVGEKIMVQVHGVTITIMPVKAECGWARIGVAAPRDVLILREELLMPEERATADSAAGGDRDIQADPVQGEPVQPGD